MIDAGADTHRRPDAGAHAWRSTRARRCTTAASARASTASRSASWSTARRSASTTRARTSGPSATRSGAGWSRSSPGRSRCSIIDSKAIGRFMPPVFPGVKADTLAELARAARPRRGDASCDTVADLQRRLPRRHASTTPRSTTATPRASTPAKTHWARPLDTPPFYGYPLRPGITFTYLGLKVDEHAAGALRRRSPAPTCSSAGEMMAGNVLGKGYTAGVGMTHRHRLRPHRRHPGGRRGPRKGTPCSSLKH